MGLMIYVLHVQDLCELRERPIPLFDFVSLAFLCYFLFGKKRETKIVQVNIEFYLSNVFFYIITFIR